MKKLLITNWILVLLIIISSASYSQGRETEKVFFLGRMAQKYKSSRDYSLTIGYITLEERDVYFEFSGGTSGFKLKETVPVKSGRGKFMIKLGGESLPDVGKGYKITIGLREKGGDEKTTKALTVINNIELVNEAVPFSNNASFSNTTPNSLDYDSFIDFKIDYSFKDENQIHVSIWDGAVWIASSEIETLQAGAGIKDMKVMLPNKIEGTNFKFVLNFGTADDFKNKTTKSEEILGVKITKPLVYSVADLSKKSTQLTVSSDVNVLELPGDPIYDFIKVIDKNGKVVKEVINTNKVNIYTLIPETYYIITQSGYYFKFTKGF